MISEKGFKREACPRLEESLGLIILMKCAQMCELPTDSAATQTGDENQRRIETTAIKHDKKKSGRGVF